MPRPKEYYALYDMLYFHLIQIICLHQELLDQDLLDQVIWPWLSNQFPTSGTPDVLNGITHLWPSLP